jgi:hypothetical protein
MATPESILSMLASVIVIFVTLITNKKIFTISETDKIDIVIGDERKSLKSFIYKNPYLILHYIVLLLLCFGSYTRIKVMNDLLHIWLNWNNDGLIWFCPLG